MKEVFTGAEDGRRVSGECTSLSQKRAAWKTHLGETRLNG